MGFLSDSFWNIVFGITGVAAEASIALNSLGINTSSSPTSSFDDPPVNNFFAYDDLDCLKNIILSHMVSIETQLIANRINFYTAPFEQWIQADVLSSIKEQFEISIRNTHNGAIAHFLNEQLTPNNSDCQKVFSIPSEAERKDAIEAYHIIIEKRSCEQFAMLCDNTITDLLPKLLSVAEQVLSDKRTEQQQRDLDREKLLVSRAKLTLIDDYLNLNS